MSPATRGLPRSLLSGTSALRLGTHKVIQSEDVLAVPVSTCSIVYLSCTAIWLFLSETVMQRCVVLGISSLKNKKEIIPSGEPQNICFLESFFFQRQSYTENWKLKTFVVHIIGLVKVGYNTLLACVTKRPTTLTSNLASGLHCIDSVWIIEKDKKGFSQWCQELEAYSS